MDYEKLVWGFWFWAQRREKTEEIEMKDNVSKVSIYIGSFSRVLRGYQTRQPAAGLKGQSWSGRVLSPAQSGHKGPLGLRGYLIIYWPMACNHPVTKISLNFKSNPIWVWSGPVTGFHNWTGFGLKERQKQKQKNKTSLSFSSFFFILFTNCVLPEIFFFRKILHWIKNEKIERI